MRSGLWQRVGGGPRCAQHWWLPRRLLLIRHGESEANVNRAVYSVKPDWRIDLTPRGRQQAFECGQRLRHIIQDEKISIYYSPYVRARQTLEEIRKSLSEVQIQGEREDERLREQEIGNYQPLNEMDRIWKEREEFGRLYYRFPFGESGADVGNRVSGFFDSLLREHVKLMEPTFNEDPIYEDGEDMGWRGLGRRSARGSEGEATFQAADSAEVASPDGSDDRDGSLLHADLEAAAHDDQNVVIISHGLLIRLFIGRWFNVPMEVFEAMLNPPNCSIVVLERAAAVGRLVMTDVSKQLFGDDPLLQMVKFDGSENTQWYFEKFLGILDFKKGAAPPFKPPPSFHGRQ